MAGRIQNPRNPSEISRPEIKAFFEILSRCPLPDLDSALVNSAIRPDPELVQGVLKLSYSIPESAVKFFRWAGIASKHTSYSWNLIIDILGKNQLFETMWDAIRSMKQENLLSVATFFSVFGSYCDAGRVQEAVMTFDVMDKYGIPRDVVAVNALLSAICRSGSPAEAVEFFDRVKSDVPPDGDTFAIMLEGWGREGKVTESKKTFKEMATLFGWGAEFMPAYNAFFTTLLRESHYEEALEFLLEMKEHDCPPGMELFSQALEILSTRNDSRRALSVWKIMIKCGLSPNRKMFNTMIDMLCHNKDIDMAYYLLDEMVYSGSFPDSLIYNKIFHCLIKNSRVREVVTFFSEMTKSECPPSHSNCEEAINMLFECDDPETAIEVWNFMIEYPIMPCEESSNLLLVKLRDMDRLTEVARFAEEMIDRGITIYSGTWAKLKSAFYKSGRHEAYDLIAKKWKEH